MNIVKIILVDEITGEKEMVVKDTDAIHTDFYTLLVEEVANDKSLPF